MNPRSSIAFVLACLLVLSGAGIASAHAELVESEPADGETVATPTTLSATYSEPLNPEGSRIVVRNAAGQEVARGEVTSDDRLTMSVELPELPDGDYVARWTARADDGHVTRGEIAFMVEAPAATPTPAPATPVPTEQPTPTAPTPNPASPSPTPTPDDEPAAGVTDVLMALVLAGVVVGGLALYLLRRR